MPLNGCLKEIKIDEMEGKYLAITCQKKDIMDNTNVFIVNDYAAKEGEAEANKSGRVLLLYCVHDHQRHYTGWEFNRGLVKALTTSKQNIITKKKNHNGSEGKYFSYGNKANFEIINHSSVSQYAYKLFKDDEKSTASHLKNNAIECICSHELGVAMDSLSGRLHNLRDLISPILDVAYSEQKHKGYINLKKVQSSDHGCWQTQVCVNASTEKFHTEKDCTYTLIHVPKQKKSSDVNQQYRFVFQLMKHMNICITLRYGVSFIFSGQFLTHRQQCTKPHNTTDDFFFNIASYGNNRLYSHIKKSFHRK